MARILLHVGFPKAGSTFLQEWFKDHPEIYYQPKYVAQGFYNAWQLARDVQNSDTSFENYVYSCEDLMLWQGRPYWYGLTGTEPYNYRSFQNRICETLNGIFPTAKVLMVTRGYRTIFPSIYAQYVSMGGTFSCDELMKTHEEMFTTFLDYDYIIDLYRKKFGYENVIILPYELLKENPLKFLSLIEQQLNISRPFEFPYKRINAAMDEKNLNAYYRTSRFVFRLLKPFSHDLQIKLYLLYCKVIRAKVPHPFLTFVSKFLKKTISLDGTEEIILKMKGKAEILRNEVHHQPFLKEYLINDFK